MLEKYGTPRCTYCDSANIINHGADEIMTEVDMEDDDGKLEKRAVLIKTGKTHYECSGCGLNFYGPRF